MLKNEEGGKRKKTLLVKNASAEEPRLLAACSSPRSMVSMADCEALWIEPVTMELTAVQSENCEVRSEVK